MNYLQERLGAKVGEGRSHTWPHCLAMRISCFLLKSYFHVRISLMDLGKFLDFFVTLPSVSC